MTQRRCAPTLLLLVVGITIPAYAQKEKAFPTDEEIRLVLTQTDRAIQQYKPLIDQQETQLTGVKEAAANDRKVVAALEIAVKAFREKPQAFNGPLGFAFFEWLDDMDRNALLCQTSAESESQLQAVGGDLRKATELTRLGQSCLDASTLIYTVSENAGSLYARYAEAEEQLAIQSVKIAGNCAEVLKKNGTAPKSQQ